ncbi:MAG: DUF483 domain-containing protein [Candidatus Methanomethylicia archaeon]|nr:DUF483 domain-containing protein [Candidatus Methanomethylicia archaeon]
MNELLKLFLEDKRILDRVKIEDYLSVYFDVRPSSFFTMIAELPNAKEIGSKIDIECKDDLLLIMSTRDIQLRGELIVELRHKIDKLFEKYVLKSDIFKAHEHWAKELNLKMCMDKIRPSICEVYLYKDKNIGKRIKNLFYVRSEIRKAIYKMQNVNLPPSLLAYPEELSSKFVSELGLILGYPECCVKRYADERASGIYVEGRISNQIKDLKKVGDKPNVFSFFSSNFIPHDPKCENAAQIGLKLYEILKREIPGAHEIYYKLLLGNVETSENLPEIIRSYRQNADLKVKDLLMYV